MMVSVPYRGTTFLNRTISVYDLEANWFPSPIGELHFSMDKDYSTNLWEIKFPSPIGELHFSMMILFAIDVGITVSVPYRGATFLNTMPCLLYGNHKMVSVPYRGATFLNNIGLLNKLLRLIVSVPYRGATFLNSM